MVGLPVLVGVGGSVLVQSSLWTPEQRAMQALGPVAQALVQSNDGHPVLQDAFGSHVSSVSDGDGGSTDGATITPAAARAALERAVPKGDVLVPVTSADVRAASPAGSMHAYVAMAPTAELAMVTGGALTAGSWPKAFDQVALDTLTAVQLGAAQGDGLELSDRDGTVTNVTVSGIFDAELGGHDLVGIPGALAADHGARSTWYVRGDLPFGWDSVQAINAAGLTAVSRAVVQDPPPDPPGLDEPGTTGSSGTIAVVAAVGAIAALEVVLLIGPAFAVGARRAERQLAVVASSGGERRTLRQIVLLGGLVIGLGASFLGGILGLTGAVAVRQIAVARGSTGFPGLRVPWGFVALFVVLGVVLSLAAAWLPARRAAGVDVVAALAGRRAEARPRRRVPIIGLACVAAGAVAAVFGAMRGSSLMLVVGILVLQIGIVAASGALISLVGRLAPRAGVAGRLAMRDAARQRGRTAPAVAAVIAAIAGVVAGGIYVQSAQDYEAAKYSPNAGLGTVLVAYSAFDEWGDPTAAPSALAAEDVQREAQIAFGGTGVVPVRVGVFPTEPAPRDAASDDPADEPAEASSQSRLENLRPAAAQCPPMADDATEEDWRQQRKDSRCFAIAPASVFNVGGNNGFTPSVLIDDGSTVDALGLGDPAPLRTGRVLVGVHDLWPDGTAHFAVHSAADDSVVKTLVVPAASTPRVGQFDTVLTAHVARQLGLETVSSGFVLETADAPSDAEIVAARHLSGVTVYVERGPANSAPIILWILVGAAVVVGLGATGLAMALAAAEFRPDLATLAAIGAGPRMRRRVSAAQSGVIALLGVGLGCLSGLMLGWVLVLAKGTRSTDDGPAMLMSIPWQQVGLVAIGVPLLAIGGAYALTRSRLP
ncbi:MAG: FtsX-like permease family protein, partial [Brevundimonas sp.]